MQNTLMQTLFSELRRLAETEDIAAARDRYWAVSHGPEANSPTAQKFSERNSYPCFYPDGCIVIVEGGEADVCQFINEQRQLGFPLAVNLRWGWIKEEDRTLSVPEEKERFDWAEVDA